MYKGLGDSRGFSAEFQSYREKAYLRIAAQSHIGLKCIHEAPQARSAEGALRRRRAAPEARNAEGGQRRRRAVPKARSAEGERREQQLRFGQPCHDRGRSKGWRARRDGDALEEKARDGSNN